MPLSKPGKAPESDFSKLGDYVGEIVILTPLSEDTIDTENGPADVVLCTGAHYNPVSGAVTGLGQVTVFWTKVRAQLKAGLDDHSPIAGRIVKRGRAYELDELDEKTMAAVEKAYDWE